MNQDKTRRIIRRSVELNEEMMDYIRSVMKEKRWSLSYTCYVLLQSAIREKQRKKKIRTEDNPNDPRSGHAE